MNMYSTEEFSVDAKQSAEPVEDGAFEASWFDRFSISSKLNAVVLASTLVLAILAAGILGTMAYYGNQGEKLRALSHADSSASAAGLLLSQASLELGDYVVEGDSADLAASSQALERASNEFDQALAANPNLLDPDIVAGIEGFRQSSDDLQSRISSSEIAPNSAKPIAADLRDLTDEVAQFSGELTRLSQAEAIPVFDGIRNSILTMLGLVVVLTISSVFGARVVVRNIAGMIEKMTASMEDIAKGSSDTPIPGRERKDEIGAMARALTVFRKGSQRLRALTDERARSVEEKLEQQRKLSEQMRDLGKEKSKLLENMATGFEISVGELITAVSAASEQLKATSKQMVDLADGSNEHADGATAAMEKATANVTAAAAATDEFALSIGEISRQASASASLARDASKLVDNANTRMAELSSAADEIGEIAGLIQTIAQRTNLLALNASIEAARGGEAGRGFAVVASEVKELAMQTSNATSSVAEKITAMQDSTKSSAGDLTSIVKQIGELEQAAVMIASAVDQQSVSGEELARNIDTVANGSAQVGERLEALRAASEETGSAADDVVASAKALGDHADNLRAKAGQFIEDVRRSARELEAGEAA